MEPLGWEGINYYGTLLLISAHTRVMLPAQINLKSHANVKHLRPARLYTVCSRLFK